MNIDRVFLFKINNKTKFRRLVPAEIQLITNKKSAVIRTPPEKFKALGLIAISTLRDSFLVALRIQGSVPISRHLCRCTNFLSMCSKESWKKIKYWEWWKDNKGISGQWTFALFQVRTKCHRLRCLVLLRRWLKSKLRIDLKEKLPTECGCNTIRIWIRNKFKSSTKTKWRKSDKWLKNRDKALSRLWIFRWNRSKKTTRLKLEDPPKHFLRTNKLIYPRHCHLLKLCLSIRPRRYRKEPKFLKRLLPPTRRQMNKSSMPKLWLQKTCQMFLTWLRQLSMQINLKLSEMVKIWMLPLKELWANHL